MSARDLLHLEFWPSLFKYGPELRPIPDLAKSMLIETHTENAGIPQGHTRFTIDIINNGTWSDGTPLTGRDAADTYIYYLESAAFGNPEASSLSNLIGVYSPSTYRVVFEFNTESYWHLSDFAFKCIIPEHIFNDVDGIGYEEWNVWDPIFNASHPYVTCGPFVLSDYENSEFFEITRNPLFHYEQAVLPTTITGLPPGETSNPTTTSATSATTNGYPFNLVSMVSLTVASGSAATIVVCSVLIVKKRREE